MGLAPGRPSFCNIKTKHLKHKQIKNKKYIKKFNVTSYFEGIKFPLQHQTHVSCNIFKHHPNQNACNDTSGIDKTFQHFNQTLATCLRNTYAACATPPCNIHMQQVQHTSETFEKLKMYICNIEGESLTRGAPWPPGWEKLGRQGERERERGRRRGWGGRRRAPSGGGPPTPLQHHRATSKDLARASWILPVWGRGPPDLRALGLPVEKGRRRVGEGDAGVVPDEVAAAGHRSGCRTSKAGAPGCRG